MAFSQFQGKADACILSEPTEFRPVTAAGLQSSDDTGIVKKVGAKGEEATELAQPKGKEAVKTEFQVDRGTQRTVPCGFLIGIFGPVAAIATEVEPASVMDVVVTSSKIVVQESFWEKAPGTVKLAFVGFFRAATSQIQLRFEG